MPSGQTDQGWNRDVAAHIMASCPASWGLVFLICKVGVMSPTSQGQAQITWHFKVQQEKTFGKCLFPPALLFSISSPRYRHVNLLAALWGLRGVRGSVEKGDVGVSR